MATLEEMARLKFPDPPLSAAEERVVRAAPDGTVADCSDLGGGKEPEKADGTGETPDEKWPERRNVRADLIRWLCVDREAREQVDPRGVWIQGARITGGLDLSFTNILFPLGIYGCRVEQLLIIQGAKMTTLSLEGSWTEAIDADGLELEGALFLRNGFRAEGEVRLPGATIGGDLSARSGTFKNSSKVALNADAIKVGGGIFLSGKFLADGTVRLVGATIGGDLDARGGAFKHSNADALGADRIKVAGSVFLRNGFSAEGEVRLLGATIGGNLDAEGGTFKNLKSDRNPNSTGDALNADGVKVAGSVFLRNGFVAEGEVRLLGATIGGVLEATGGTFKNLSGDALSADGIKVHGSVFLSNGFSAEGTVLLPGAEITGQLDVNDAWLDALILDGAHVTGGFFWRNIEKDPHPDFPNKEWKPSLNLTNAKVGSLVDQPASWPEKGRLRLDGFVYDRIAAGPTDAKTRLKWLRLQPEEYGYLPQPYEQLIAVLRRMGHEHQVAKVAIAKQNDLYERGGLGWWGKVRGWFLYHAVRYGYEPRRAFGWMGALVLAGSFVFLLARLPSAPVMVPSDKEAYQPGEQAELVTLPHYYPEFNALVYSLDVILPFDLGQKSHWRLHERRSWDFVYWLFEGYSLVHLFLGWMLLLIAAAVPAGFIKKD